MFGVLTLCAPDRARRPASAPKGSVGQDGGSREAPMTLEIDWVIIDCVDIEGMSRFWCQALDFVTCGQALTAGTCSLRRTDLSSGWA